jgi:4-hydroxy-3-methylbut-2-enyl diphosphate reductase
MKFGTFVDLGSGIDGLIHISQLSWNRIKHPSEILKEGDSVDVFVIDFDKEAQRISLGYRKNEDNPWEIAKSKFNLNDIVKCKVVRMLPFGAFVELIEGVDGLIHISQIANKRIAKPDDVLSIGKEVEAKITEINWDEKKIGLSIKALIPKDETKEDKEKLISENKQEVNEEDIIPTEYSDDIKVTIGDIINKDQY